MKNTTLFSAAILLLGSVTVALAGNGYPMKCMDGTDADGKPVQGCGYEKMVVFGGGMMFHQITGYCRSCEKFVHLSWTRKGSPMLSAGADIKPKPKPLGDVWDAKTGRVLTVYPCPHCDGVFAAISGIKDLKHCPKCNGAHFKIDKTKPRIAID